MIALTISTVHEVLGMSELHIHNANIRMRSGFRLSVFNSIQFSIQKEEFQTISTVNSPVQ